MALGIMLLAFAFTQVEATSQSSMLKASPLTPIEGLGKALYFDKNLSKNGNQSCAMYRDPAAGYTGPDSAINAHEVV
jgi:cytochrome c peroxidase